MSQWTHVTGVARVDSLWGIVMPPDRTQDILQEIFSKPPTGSEGPAHIGITKTRAYNSMSWGYVSITGDLRDFDDARGIMDWFEACLARFEDAKLLVRDAVLSIDIERKDKVVVTLDPNRDPTKERQLTLAERWIPRTKTT